MCISPVWDQPGKFRHHFLIHSPFVLELILGHLETFHADIHRGIPKVPYPGRKAVEFLTLARSMDLGIRLQHLEEGLRDSPLQGQFETEDMEETRNGYREIWLPKILSHFGRFCILSEGSDVRQKMQP